MKSLRFKTKFPDDRSVSQTLTTPKLDKVKLSDPFIKNGNAPVFEARAPGCGVRAVPGKGTEHIPGRDPKAMKADLGAASHLETADQPGEILLVPGACHS